MHGRVCENKEVLFHFDMFINPSVKLRQGFFVSYECSRSSITYLINCPCSLVMLRLTKNLASAEAQLENLTGT